MSSIHLLLKTSFCLSVWDESKQWLLTHQRYPSSLNQGAHAVKILHSLILPQYEHDRSSTCNPRTSKIFLSDRGFILVLGGSSPSAFLLAHLINWDNCKCGTALTMSYELLVKVFCLLNANLIDDQFIKSNAPTPSPGFAGRLKIVYSYHNESLLDYLVLLPNSLLLSIAQTLIWWIIRMRSISLLILSPRSYKCLFLSHKHLL